MTTVADIVAAIEERQAHHPEVIVGISGYAGAGKSVLARQIVEALPSAVRLRGDDFLVPELVHQRSHDWAGVERLRLRKEVLDPFRSGRPVLLRVLNWSTRSLGPPTPLPRASVLVVDSIGIFHPDLSGCFDLTVWVDVDAAAAVQRGAARDRGMGRDDEALWIGVWGPNDHEFAQTFDPRGAADLRFVPDDVR